MDLPPLPYDWIQKLSRKVESFVLRAKPERNLFFGFVLVGLSAVLSLVAIFKPDGIFPVTCLFLCGLILLSLLNKSSDRFRYSVLCAVLLLLVGAVFSLMESGRLVGLFGFAQVFLAIQMVLIFGLEATRTVPSSPWFQWFRKINRRMQDEFDQGVFEKDIADRVRESGSRKAFIKRVLWLVQGAIVSLIPLFLYFQYRWEQIFVIVGLGELVLAITLVYIFFKLRLGKKRYKRNV